MKIFYSGQRLGMIMMWFVCFTPNILEAQDNSTLCDSLHEMNVSDQKYRSLPELRDPFSRIMDSLVQAKNIAKKDYIAFFNEQQKSNSLARQLVNKAKPIPKRKKDSLWELQSNLDSLNTHRLLKMTKEYGWPSKTALGCEKPISPVVIFRHSPKYFWNEIQSVIEKEFQAERMTRGDFDFIQHHLNGRPIPNFNKEN